MLVIMAVASGSHAGDKEVFNPTEENIKEWLPTLQLKQINT